MLSPAWLIGWLCIYRPEYHRLQVCTIVTNQYISQVLLITSFPLSWITASKYLSDVYSTATCKELLHSASKCLADSLLHSFNIYCKVHSIKLWKFVKLQYPEVYLSQPTHSLQILFQSRLNIIYSHMNVINIKRLSLIANTCHLWYSESSGNCGIQISNNKYKR